LALPSGSLALMIALTLSQRQVLVCCVPGFTRGAPRENSIGTSIVVVGKLSGVGEPIRPISASSFGRRAQGDHMAKIIVTADPPVRLRQGLL
jgi:hypothetical protein